MNKHFDLITIGDSTIDTFIKIHDATIECDINRRDCKICVAYGAKIPVDSIAHGVAGNAANVAVGAAKLGLATAIYTNLGDDDHGKTILQALEREKVASDYVNVNNGRESNLSVVLTYQGERTIFVYHQDWYYQLPRLATTSWIYLTSIAETFTGSKIMDQICHFVQKTGTKLAFGPGTYQLKADIKRYPRLLEQCELLIVNMEEAKTILAIDILQMLDVGDLLGRLLDLGPKNVIITDGAQGSYGSDGQNNYRTGIYPTKAIEKTGAGDAYSSGLLAGLILGKSLSEAMIWGTINAAHVIQLVGTQVGLLTRQELEKHQKDMPQLRAVSF